MYPDDPREVGYYCHYCKGRCQGANSDDDQVMDTWYSCNRCKAYYLVHFNGRLESLILETFYRNLRYAVELIYVTKQTHIIRYPVDPEDTLVEVALLPFLAENITPSNIGEKLPTYLVFS